MASSKFSIPDFDQKIAAILKINGLTPGEAAARSKISHKTITNWLNGGQAQNKQLQKFCEEFSINPFLFHNDYENFCNGVVISYPNVSATDLASLPKSITKDDIFGVTRGANPAAFNRHKFKEYYSKDNGYFYMYHHWSPYEHNRNKKIARHLIKFTRYDSKTNTILFDLRSAKCEKNISKWNYRGWVISLPTITYYFAESTMRKKDDDIFLLMTHTPSLNNFDYNVQCIIEKGILLAAISPDSGSGTSSRPAATRVILKKIADQQQDEVSLIESATMISEEEINDENIAELLKNEINGAGILLPQYF